MGDLEGVGVCSRCCHGDPVGSHDGFDEEEVSVVVGADEDVCFVHVWSFGLMMVPTTLWSGQNVAGTKIVEIVGSTRSFKRVDPFGI